MLDFICQGLAYAVFDDFDDITIDDIRMQLCTINKSCKKHGCCRSRYTCWKHSIGNKCCKCIRTPAQIVKKINNKRT